MFNRLFGKSNAVPVASMTVEQLSEALKQKNPPMLIDVRSPDEYSGDGHVAGSRLMPLPNLANQVANLAKETSIACICRSGGRSQAACDMLVKLGFSNITNVSGGMLAWQRAGLPVKRK